jgi:phage-related protein (TIGR01555 family)
MSDTPKIPRTDDFLNAVSGLGGSYDKSQYTFFRRRPYLQYDELSDLYEQDAIAARVIDRLVDDATREGFRIVGPDEDFDFDAVSSDLEDLGAITAIGDAWRWARLYGGAIAVMVVADGRKLSEPLDVQQAQRLLSVQVIEAPYAIPSDWNPGLGARGFRDPRRYDVTVVAGRGDTRSIDASRVMRFDGIRVPPSRLLERYGWGPSLLDRVAREIFQLGEVMGYSRNIIHEMSVMAFKIEGLREQLCGDERSQSEIRKVFETLRFAIDNMNALVLDTKDDYGEISRSTNGLRDMIEEFVSALVRATDMPRTVLLGEQPSGLNANADSEIRSWFDYVHSQQRAVLTPAVNRLLEVYFAVRSNRGDRVPSEWTIEWNPLWQMDEQQAAQARLTRAQARAIDVNSGAVSADEVRQDPDLRDVYEIDPSAAAPPPPMPAPASGVALLGQDEEDADREPVVLPDSYIRPGSTMVGTRQAAEALGVSQATVRRLAREGQIPATMVGSRMRIPLEQARETLQPITGDSVKKKTDLAPTDHDVLSTLLRAEVAYTRDLAKIARDLRRAIASRVGRRIEQLAAEGPRAVEVAVRQAIRESGAVLPDAQIRRIIRDQWARVRTASDDTVVLMVGSASSIDRDRLLALAGGRPEDPENPTRDEQIGAVLAAALAVAGDRARREWARANTELIRDIPAKHEQDLVLALTEAVEQGKGADRLREIITERDGITERRTQTIAEDQTQKGVGQLQQERLGGAGVGQYTWRTMMDDRVRDEHAAREGQVFAWDQPPEDGHPGEPVNCRCVAEPVLELE